VNAQVLLFHHHRRSGHLGAQDRQHGRGISESERRHREQFLDGRAGGQLAQSHASHRSPIAAENPRA
jgi:hypothetical protein